MENIKAIMAKQASNIKARPNPLLRTSPKLSPNINPRINATTIKINKPPNGNGSSTIN